MFPGRGLDLRNQVLGLLEEPDPHLKQEGTLLVDPVIPDDLPVQSERLICRGDSDFQKALFRCGRGGMEHVQAVGMDDVCEQRQAAPGKILKLS